MNSKNIGIIKDHRLIFLVPLLVLFMCFFSARADALNTNPSQKVANSFNKKLSELTQEVAVSPGQLDAEIVLFEIWALWDFVLPKEMIKSLEFLH